MTKDICDNADKVLPNTIAEGELLEKGLWINPNKIQIIHNGVEARFADADPSLFQKKYNLKDFILYVGHLGPDRKNGRNIIKALQKLDHPAVIIADVLHNPEGEWCRREIEKSKNITLIEWLNHDDPLFASSYAACHTFILPTKYETPGRAALEAGLAGANIVITPRGGTKEYFEDMALYPNPLSVESIVKSIEKSLNRKKEVILKEHIQKNFIWEVVAEQTLRMYQNVIG
jgi:glycosyltransferase involved in cell wall biosynthesis